MTLVDAEAADPPAPNVVLGVAREDDVLRQWVSLGGWPGAVLAVGWGRVLALISSLELSVGLTELLCRDLVILPFTHSLSERITVEADGSRSLSRNGFGLSKICQAMMAACWHRQEWHDRPSAP